MKKPCSRAEAAAWLGVCRGIAAELASKVRAIAGTPKAARVVRECGAGGDETTFVDDLAERTVIKHLRQFQKSGRTFSLLTEEIGRVSFGADFPLVVVDPIDGSINCKRGLPMYALSIGVYGGPAVSDGIFGYVMNIPNGDEYRAVSGAGAAFLNNKRIRLPEGNNKNIDLLLYEVSRRPEIRGRALPLIDAAGKSRSLGCLALAVLFVATGAADMYAHLKSSRVLDYAAAKIVLEEAGGVMCDERGRSLDNIPIDLARHGMLIAAQNRALAGQAVRAMKS